MIRMKALFFLATLTAMSTAHAADGDISPDNIDYFDHNGYFSSDFKSAMRAVVASKVELSDSRAKEKKLADALPELQRQALERQAEAVALRQELAKYDHPEENDFTALQAVMNDANAKPEDQIALAQAYVWTYPSSPHETEAQQFLKQVQKVIVDRKEAERLATVDRAAAHAKLVQRALAHDLAIGEWRDLLRDMSQADLVKLIGQPSLEQDGYWIYKGDYCTAVPGHRKAGLQINFNGGRVLSVDEKP